MTPGEHHEAVAEMLYTEYMQNTPVAVEMVDEEIDLDMVTKYARDVLVHGYSAVKLRDHISDVCDHIVDFYGPDKVHGRLRGD